MGKPAEITDAPSKGQSSTDLALQAAVVTYDLGTRAVSGRVDGLDGFVWKFDDHVSDCLTRSCSRLSSASGVPCFMFRGVPVEVRLHAGSI
jgi:hypothetical protein